MGRRRGERSPVTGLTKTETVLLNGVLPILVLGVCAPVGTVAFCLLLRSDPVRGAVDHGELLLGAGNAALIGAFAYLSARPNGSVLATIGAIVYIVLVGLTSYAGWAYVTTEALSDERFSRSAALYSGLALSVVSAGVSLYLVARTFQGPWEQPRT